MTIIICMAILAIINALFVYRAFMWNDIKAAAFNSYACGWASAAFLVLIALQFK